MSPIPPGPTFRSECLRCRRPAAVCLCAHITTLRTRTRFVFLTHPKEARKIKNGTGRIAHLAMPGSELLVGIDFREHPRVRALLADPSLRCRLLYPKAPGAPMDAGEDLLDDDVSGRTPVLFLLDATWPFAKKMMRLSTNLQGLPRLSLKVGRPSEFAIKHQPHPACLGTIEAVDRTLLALAEAGVEQYTEEDSERLLRPFRHMNQLALDAAADPNRVSYRSQRGFKAPTERVPRRPSPTAGRSLLYRSPDPERSLP
ncbi:MAG: DTW domain-containing protein [Deltaproteobacteria bacterium]|nr:DTW domain-containing protein [Deltaproteobacteria bacterium]